MADLLVPVPPVLRPHLLVGLARHEHVTRALGSGVDSSIAERDALRDRLAQLPLPGEGDQELPVPLALSEGEVRVLRSAVDWGWMASASVPLPPLELDPDTLPFLRDLVSSLDVLL